MRENEKMTERILLMIQCPDLLDKLSTLPHSDLNSLLIALYERQAQRITPGGLLKSYRSNRFVAPSRFSPVEYLKLELAALQLAEKSGVLPVLLSPVAPLGSCSAVAPVSQNKVLSAARGTEVLSDATNMLALVLADKIKSGEWRNSHEAIHVCAAHRLTRAQAFSGSGHFAHFGLFCMVSSGQDTGSYRCETELLEKQLAFHVQFVTATLGADTTVVLHKRRGYPDADGFFARMSGRLAERFPHIAVEAVEPDADNAYYQGVNFKILIHTGGKEMEIGDGGFVDWTQKLLANKKERLLISAIAIDRLLMLSAR